MTIEGQDVLGFLGRWHYKSFRRDGFLRFSAFFVPDILFFIPSLSHTLDSLILASDV